MAKVYSINGHEYEVKRFGIKQLEELKNFIEKNSKITINDEGDSKITIADILNSYIMSNKIAELLSIIIAKVENKWTKDGMIPTQGDIIEDNMDVDLIGAVVLDFCDKLPNWKNILEKYLGNYLEAFGIQVKTADAE